MERLHLTLLLVLLMAIMGLSYGMKRSLKLQLNWHLKVCLVPIFLYLAWMLSPENSLPYIYFDF